MDITITPAAEKFIRSMIRFSGVGANAGFRLQVSAGGCSGLAADFSVEDQPAAGDSVLDVNGAKLFLPAESRLLLEGVTIDFADTPTNSGLSFIDPKAKDCACSSAGTTSVDIASIGRGR